MFVFFLPKDEERQLRLSFEIWTFGEGSVKQRGGRGAEEKKTNRWRGQKKFQKGLVTKIKIGDNQNLKKTALDNGNWDGGGCTE